MASALRIHKASIDTRPGHDGWSPPHQSREFGRLFAAACNPSTWAAHTLSLLI
jgi:hypothetical protein